MDEQVRLISNRVKSIQIPAVRLALHECPLSKGGGNTLKGHKGTRLEGV